MAGQQTRVERWTHGWRGELLLALLFGILPLLIFADVTLGGRTMIPADNLYQWQPWAAHAAEFNAEIPQNSLLSDLVIQNSAWKQFTIDSLRRGEIPLWSPHILSGAPFLANGQHSMLYPFSVLFFVLPVWLAYGWFTVSQLWLAGLSGYAFGRLIGQRRSGALVAGLVYQGAGFLLVGAAVFPMIVAAAVWLPFLIGCLNRIIRHTTSADAGGRTLPWALAAAGALGMNILAGHPEMTYYTLLIMALFAAWRLPATLGSALWRRPAASVRPAAWLLATVALGIVLGALQLLPAFELAGSNFREGGATLAEVRGWAFPPRRILTLALPNFFGNPSHHAYTDALTGERVPFTLNAAGQANPHGAFSSSWGIKNYVEGGIYLGILPLALALIAVGDLLAQALRRRPRAAVGAVPAQQGWFMVVLALLSLSFIFGTPLYAILYYGLPFINQLHSPFRWVFALSLCVAGLAGYGLDALLAGRGGRWVAWLLVLGGGLTLVGASVARQLYPRLAALIERTFLALAQAPDAFADGRAFFSYLLPQFYWLGIVALLGGLLLLLAHRRPRTLTLLAFALIVVDVWGPNHSFHAAVDPALLRFEPQLVQWLKAQPGLWRLTTFAPKDTPYNANAPWLAGFHDVRGYDSIINRQYVAYMQAIEPQNELPFNRIQPIKTVEALNSPLLDLLNVRYIITSEQVPLPKLAEVWTGEGVRVYENLAVMARAYTLPASAAFVTDAPLAALQRYDARGVIALEQTPAAGTTVATPQPAAAEPATVTAYGNVEVWVDAEVTAPAWLVLADSYAPGWRAYVRPIGGEDSAEQEVELLRANGNFRAVPLEEGAWSVRFRYSPRSFIVGGLLSFLGGIVVLFSAGVWGWRRVARPGGVLTNTQSIAKNSVVPMALNLFNKVIDFAYAAFYLRVLGPAEAGAFATAISIALWFEIVANWGLDALIIRDVAQERAQAGRYLVNTTLLRVATMALGVLPMLVFIGEGAASGNPYPRDVILALALIAVGMIFSGIGKGVTGIFYVFEAAEYPAALATVTTILKVVLGVIALLIGWGFVGMAGVSIATNVITLLLLLAVALRRFPLKGPYTIDWGLQRHAFVVGWPLMLNHLLATIFFKIDQPLLYRLSSEQAAGWYNSAYKWVDSFNIIPSFFTFALFPVISRQVAADLAAARRTFRMAVKLLVLVALPLAAVVTLLADVMIGTLGGTSFLPHGAIALRLVIWSIPIGWINSVTNYTIVSLGLERRLTWAFVAGVLFNTVGNILLIPRYGYVAAAITTIFSELILLLLFNRYLNERMRDIGWGALLWRPLAVTALMVAAMLLAAQVHLLFGLLAGVAIYLGGLWALRIIGAEERQIAARVLPASLARRLGLLTS